MPGFSSYFALIAKGMAMGAADVVPGVSGGTIAFITGIYDRLINALKSFNPALLKVLGKEGVAAAWRHIDGTFFALCVWRCIEQHFILRPWHYLALIKLSRDALGFLFWSDSGLRRAHDSSGATLALGDDNHFVAWGWAGVSPRSAGTEQP